MIYISKDLVTQIIEHSKDGFPNEVCGILAGKDNQVTKVYKMKNNSTDPIHCYFMEPQEQLKVFKEMRKDNLEMLGIYHSHSYVEAYPSSKDVELAFYPEASYVIISLKDENSPQIRSFKIIEGKISEEEIKMADS